MVGEVLDGRYEVEELVGTGGMSSVYRAHDRLLERKVALKVLHQQYGDDPDYVERFRREARAVAALSHPNIVTVIDRGEHEGRQFIVFEYVDGENLKRLIERRGAAPVATALELAMQIARALSFAHQNGLVHRDVKPQNVLLNGDGQAKVTDFGIARSLDVRHAGMTQTGTVPRVDAAVQRAMAKDREDRFPTMADFCAELEACLAQLQKTQVLPPPRPVRRQRARRRSSAWPIVVALVALIAAGAVAAFLLLHQTGGNGNSKSSVHGGGSLPGGMVPLHAVNAYDPFGSPVGQEHNDKAHYATDGDSRTYWETESYNDHPNLDKPGVGLILDADKSVQLQQLAFSTGTPGFVAEIKGSDSAGGFSDVVAPPQTTGSVTKYKIHGGPFRYYLIWITKLGGNYSQAVINEVKAN